MAFAEARACCNLASKHSVGGEASVYSYAVAVSFAGAVEVFNPSFLLQSFVPYCFNLLQDLEVANYLMDHCCCFDEDHRTDLKLDLRFEMLQILIS